MANMGCGKGGFCVNFDLIFFSFFFCGSSFGFGFCHWFDLILGWIFFVGSWWWCWGLPWFGLILILWVAMVARVGGCYCYWFNLILIWFCFLYGFLGFDGHEFVARVSRKQQFGFVLSGGASGRRGDFSFGFLFLFGFWDILFYCVEMLC